jgi:hypothetical protein
MSYLGNQIRGGSMVAERFSGNGSETEFNLNHDYGNEASVLVTIAGVKQTTDTYAVRAGKLIFTSPPASGSENIEIVYMGGSFVTNPYLSADSQGTIRINGKTVSENVTISSTYNASAAGPLTIANGFSITVAANSTFTIF